MSQTLEGKYPLPPWIYKRLQQVHNWPTMFTVVIAELLSNIYGVDGNGPSMSPHEIR
jgi:hypothetical protein